MRSESVGLGKRLGDSRKVLCFMHLQEPWKQPFKLPECKGTSPSVLHNHGMEVLLTTCTEPPNGLDGARCKALGHADGTDGSFFPTSLTESHNEQTASTG